MLQPVKPRTLLQALRVVNTTPGSADFLPPADCTMLTTVDAKCSGPYPGISQAYFQMYPSLTALYAAYQAEIKQVNNGQFPVNVQDCGSSAPPPGGAELSWNHFAQHTRAYSIKQLETGSLNGASQAAGRMFCSYSSSTNTTTIVWTETDGRMLGVVNGSPHHIVWIWWMGVHHNVAFSDDQMGNPARKPMKM